MEEDREPQRPLPASRAGLVLAALALLLCWIPWLGFLLAFAAIVVCVCARGRARVGWAIGLAGYALLLGATFTVVHHAFRPAVETDADRERFEAFDRAFAPPKGGSGGAESL